MKNCPKCQTPHTKLGTFCSRTCANSRTITEEGKAYRREWSKANPKGFVADPSKAHIPAKGTVFGKSATKQPDVTRTCLVCQSSFTVPYYRRTRNYCDQHKQQKGGFQKNSTNVCRSMYKGFQMDSGAELAFAQLLDQHNVKWEKNSTRSFTFVDSEGKDRLYYPDFYLPVYDYWVEIKGKRYAREDDQLRLKAVGNIELMMSDAIQLPKCIGPLDGN